MTRVLSLACLVLVICFTGSAWAAKPKIAVLGLEAAPGPGGAVDPATTQIAREITRELRQRAQSGASPYMIAPNSSKELTEEKLLMSCDNEAPSCMAVIGAGLAADFLLYGRVEKKGEVYRISLKLLDVKAKNIQAGTEDLPVGGAAASVSKRLYNKLIGDVPVVGTLVVKATSQTGAAVSDGTVMIDEEPRGSLASGRLTVTGISEGRHTIAIEAGGYRRFEETVTVHGGEQATLSALLLDRVGPAAAASSHSVLWKVSLGASLAVAVAGGAYAAYANNLMLNKKVEYLPAPPPNAPPEGQLPGVVDVGDCGDDAETIARNKHSVVTTPGVFHHACTWNHRIYIGYIVGGVGVLGAVASLIMMSRDGGSSEAPATGARGKKPEVALVPVVTPDSAGASFSVRW